MPYYEISIDDIEFYEQLGAGTYGSVYRALWKSKGKVVAVKKLLVLAKEAEVLSTLSHRHIVQFYGACTVSPHYGIVTEYAVNGCLFNHLEQHVIDFKQILCWAKQIALGLNYLHTEAPSPVIHRDLKSKNVVIDADFSVKICDFGSSKFHQNTTKMTLTGTFPWMSPEMIQQLPVSAATDIFSYGVVLWELLTHEVPFRGLEGMAVAWLVVGRGVRLTIPASCPEPFSHLMRSCWETKPDQRPTCKAILDALEGMLKNDALEMATDSFIQNKESWKVEIEERMVALKLMERQLSDKEKELVEREKQIAEKEKQLQEKKRSKAYEPYDVNGWTEDEVADWVCSLGASAEMNLGQGELSAYAELFKENHITGKRLFLVTMDDLLQIGMFSVGHRREVLDAVQRLMVENRRLLHFPPLPGTNPMKAPPRQKSSSVQTLSLTLIYGSLFRKGPTPEENKWKMYVDADGDPEAKGCIKEVVFVFSKSIPADIISLMQAPYMMEQWRKGAEPGEVECLVQYKDHVQKPQQTKWTFAPSPSNLQDEVTVELEVRHSPIIEKATIPECTPPDPKLDLHSGLLTAAGMEQVDMEPQELRGIWKDRSIFSTQSSAASLHSDQGFGCVQCDSMTPTLPSDLDLIPNLKGAWATKGMTGAHVVQQSPLPSLSGGSTSSLRYPVEEEGGTVLAHPCHCCRTCVAHHPHSLQCCFHTHMPHHYHSPAPYCSQTSGESSRNSSFTNSYSSQELDRSTERALNMRTHSSPNVTPVPGNRYPPRRVTTGDMWPRPSPASGSRTGTAQGTRGSTSQVQRSESSGRGHGPPGGGIQRSRSDGRSFVTPQGRSQPSEYDRSQSDPTRSTGGRGQRGRGRGGRGGGGGAGGEWRRGRRRSGYTPTAKE